MSISFLLSLTFAETYASLWRLGSLKRLPRKVPAAEINVSDLWKFR